VGMIIAIIATIYYFTEVKPFEYDGFENKINEFKKFDAELDEAIVQTQYGIIKNYDPIVNAMNGLYKVIDDFKRTQTTMPKLDISTRIEKLEDVTNQKYELVEKFKQLNPILINSIYNFSSNLSLIIEDQAYDELIENCLTMDYTFQSVEKARTLFTGMMIYTNVPDEATRLKLKKLVVDIKNEPEKLEKLDLAIIYADVILEVKPKLNSLNNAILNIPIGKNINSLYDAYESEYEHYEENSNKYRIVLYGLVFGLLVVLRWAFRRLEKTISKLNDEVVVRKKAEDELETINKELEQRVEDRTKELKSKNKDLNTALGDLKEAQNQLVMKEKMASVGMLTTGIAHEIKNPLNFVNNFSDLSTELLTELMEEIDTFKKDPSDQVTESINEIIIDLQTNCRKINEHGKRADNIVKNMLLHSQESSVQREKVDFNNLVSENIRLAYDTQKTKNKNIKVEVEKELDPNVGKLLLTPQAVGRVISYMVDNAIYSVTEKQKTDPSYIPKIKVKSHKTPDNITVTIRDNGEGIPEGNLRKIFEPFFTTKPTGTGTGLGLSICYDTIVKQHDGEIDVQSKEGEYTEFTIKLPVPKSSESKD
jgi:two-component system, NtrC family, sensor kinase